MFLLKFKSNFLTGIVSLMLMVFPILSVQAMMEVPTSKGFQDQERSHINMSASSLDLRVSSPDQTWQAEATAEDLLPGESVTRNFLVENKGGMNFQYQVEFQKTSGDDNLCSALQLKVEKGIQQVWQGNLNDFQYVVSNLNSGKFDKWHFVLTLPDSVQNLNSLDCNFKFVWIAWQTNFSSFTQGWSDKEEISNHIHSGINAPIQTGYNEDNGDDYSTPRNPNEIACQGGYTHINHISVHWTDVAHNNARIKYQRQYKKFGAYNWRGNEIYTHPYTNYRTFGGNPGHEGKYGSRVRAWDDVNNNNQIDAGETVSEWSNECSITYDVTPPAMPTGLRRIAPNENNKVYSCGSLSKIQRMWPDWDDNTEADFDHYEYTSFNAPNGQIGLNEKIFYDSIFQYTGGWMPKDGTYGFAVRAVDKAGNKSAWALGGSKTLEDSCQITYDSTAPVVKITNLEDNDVVSGVIDIKGTVKDAHPDHYWLVVEDENGHQVAGPGVVSDSNSFTDKKLTTWDTTKVADGKYLIKLEARDVLGNKDPDQAPVGNDPENPYDSVDWVSVEVDNTPADIREVKINDIFFEMATKGDENPSKNKNTLDIVIDWKTDEKTSGWLEWGNDKYYGHVINASAEFEAGKTKHHAVIKNLPANNEATYHFRIKVSDQAGNFSYSKDKKVKTKGATGFSISSGDIVLNEFMANPVGDDGAKKPKGEWIELYNKGNTVVNLDNWFLADKGWNPLDLNNKHTLKITSQNTNTSKTIIKPQEHLVVYVNRGRKASRGEFSLGNRGDSIFLIKKEEICIIYDYDYQCETSYIPKDNYSYEAKDVVEGKSIARFPDGGNTWIDPKATPGEDNQLTLVELKKFRKTTLKKCFKDNGKLKKNKNKDKLCDRDFLVYLGMLKNKTNVRVNKRYFSQNEIVKKTKEKVKEDIPEKKNIPNAENIKKERIKPENKVEINLNNSIEDNSKDL